MRGPKFDIESMKDQHNFDKYKSNPTRKISFKELYFDNEEARDLANHGISQNSYLAYEAMEMSFRYRNFPINDI